MSNLFSTYPLVDFDSPKLAGQFMGAFTGEPFVDFSEIETKEKEKKPDLTGLTIAGYPIENLDKLSSPVQTALILKDINKIQEERWKAERDPEFLREQGKVLDEINARQMARAQKYGKESAFYGFMYQGLPKLMAQAAFSKYAFAPEMVKGVQDAYSRMNLAGAVKPHGGQSYMSINPMGGIG